MAENKTKIDIFSGFLGVAKTTLIKSSSKRRSQARRSS